MSQIVMPNHMIDCVRHADPYPFYEDALSKGNLYYDEGLKAWLALSAEAVEAILRHPACAVRPLSAPVPPNLLESSAGTIFQHLIRMREGDYHAGVKSTIKDAMQYLPLEQLVEISQASAETIYLKANSLNQFAADLPVYVMATLLDMPHKIVALIQEFALCLNPMNSADQIEAGKHAARRLMSMLSTQESAFYKNVAKKTSAEIATANCIGLLFQSYEATAGLIGNAVQTMALYPEIRAQLIENTHVIDPFIKEVNRWNPSVQNTRRYLTSDATILGKEMAREDVVIVVLASANRDPQVNPDPHGFLLNRENRQSYTFGLGHHACIGEMIAFSIAEAAIRQILNVNADVLIDAHATSYQTYANLRIPILRSKQEHDE